MSAHNLERVQPVIRITVDERFLQDLKRARDMMGDDDNQETSEGVHDLPAANRGRTMTPGTDALPKRAKKPRIPPQPSSAQPAAGAGNRSNPSTGASGSRQRNANAGRAKARVLNTQAASSNSSNPPKSKVVYMANTPVGPVLHAHQSRPPYVRGLLGGFGLNEYSGRKTVAQWSKAEAKYRKSVKTIKVPVYEKAFWGKALDGAVEANIDLTLEGEQHGAEIGKLSDQLLVRVFQHCSHIETLSTVVTVCRQWRRAGLEPAVWRHVSAEQCALEEQLMKCNTENERPLARRLQHVESLTLDTIHFKYLSRQGRMPDPRSVFPQLKAVYFSWAYYERMLYFTDWMPDLEVIWAERLTCLSRHPQQLIFSVFGNHMRTLKRLSMRFDSGCAVEGYVKDSPRTPNTLPSTLEVLELVNVYDEDEEDHMKHLRRGQEKIKMDDQRSGYAQLERGLMTKYGSLGSMRHLRSFTFGRCNAWTAATWRHCLLPCAPNLEFLSLAGWDNRQGLQDTPDERLKARRSRDEPVSLAERAIADIFGRMGNIQKIELVKFAIGFGVLEGVRRLMREHKEEMALYINGKKARNGLARLESLEGKSVDIEMHFD